ncbi:hypothetical protein [Actinophytocola xanthii]|nr:hypothetical protein [Actinophytocola xanthii]
MAYEYAFGQLERALRRSVSDRDPRIRKRARARAARWGEVLAGMVDGTLTIGSRTPVAATPAWVTLEVVQGGFATGRYLAETDLRDDEAALVANLPAEAPGSTPRERLNLWYLTDAGLAALRTALSSGNYRIDLPEDAALPVVAWLLDDGQPVERHASALDVIAELRPLMHRLRFTPRPTTTPAPQGAMVRLRPVSAVRESLREITTSRQLGAMRETLGVWHPLYDRLVELWSDTVDGELPQRTGESVTGGWPCRVWPADWTARRARWLADHAEALQRHPLATAHRHPRGNFARLHAALLACERDSGALSGRDVGQVRRALADTITKHGAPGSAARVRLRATQRAVAARPTHAALADVVAGRLDRFPDESGVPAVEPLTQPTTADEAPGVPAGEPVPPSLVAKVTRALEAPVEELVERGVIRSGDVLATVLPQLTSSLLAASIADPALAGLYAQTYTAFRRRRGLLLVDLAHQVGIEELPWIGALEPLRTHRRAQAANTARQTLTQATVLALSSFPQAILPNTLVRELGALARQAELRLPLMEELAADIFTGRFTRKWRDAAGVASRVLAGTLYARYYDLPGPDHWTSDDQHGLRQVVLGRHAKQTARAFAELCVRRAAQAQGDASRFRHSVAANGVVLEQSQILTTHNLAVLVDGLGLADRVAALAPDLADRALEWVVRRQKIRVDGHAALLAWKNSAYAWRQAIFFLSFCDQRVQRAAVERLRDQIEDAGLTPRLSPAADGLGHVVEGGRFTADGTTEGGGRRLLGWSLGPRG